ncbi:MAG: hypothetical protein J6A95_07725 [Clostridia bacterium]|nr:hypothetical protein [Clostridia bacterium]
MKKLLALCLTVVLCLCCLASCGSAHKENEWFSEEKLTNCLVGDLPTVQKEYVNHNDEDIYVYLTDSEFKAYVKSVYDYLCSQEYKYLGTRGEQKNTLAGAFTTYYFEPATELESFRVLEGDYVFVFSDGSTDENGDVEFIILVIYDVSTNTLEYGNKKFTYNTQISLRRDSEAPLSGFYVLKEIAEGNHFIRNQAGAQWLGEITAEDIAEIKMISGGGGPLPPVSKTHISSSRNKAVISNIFEEYYWLDSKPVSEESTQIADGGYTIVQFILNNGETKQLYFINGDFYQDDNDSYFEIARLPVFRDGMNFVTRYGFERQYDPFQIHLIDGAPVCEIPFSEFEFTELTDDIYLGYELPTHYFEIHGERVYFIKGEYFYIGDNRNVYYQLIGNLDDLIAKYSTEKCNHEWDDGIEVEGGNGCYVMDYTCTLCGDKKREHITIIPPENHFLRNQAGCEWLNEITAEDIAKIKIISEAVGVAPGNLKNISSSTDEDVIARIFEEYYWLDTAPISKMEGQIDGGGGVTVKFILKNGTAKELYINNGNYLDTNGDYFELLSIPKFKDTDNAIKAYGFITYIGTGTVYDKGNNPVCEIPMDEFEFVVFSGLDAVITGYYYRVETEFGTLWFDSSNDVFYLRFNEVEVDYREYREYYQLIGKNLDELIAEYSATSTD